MKQEKNINQLDAKCKCLQFQFIGKHDYNSKLKLHVYIY